MLLESRRSLSKTLHAHLILEFLPPTVRSVTTPDGRQKVELDEILLNGNNIAMMVPGAGTAEADKAPTAPST